MERERKKGRPPKFAAGERTRGPLTVRLRDRVRSELETAAADNGRSLSEEIEHRIEISLARRDDLQHQWGRYVFAIAEGAAKALKSIQGFTGKDWITDQRTYDLFAKTVNEIVSRVHGQAQMALVDDPLEAKNDVQLVDTFATGAGVIHPRAFADPDPAYSARDNADFPLTKDEDAKK
jgi:hypothetical protein